MLNYSRQTIEDDDIELVTAALRSEYITQGPFIARFEAMLAEYVGLKLPGVAVCNASCGLIAVMASLSVGPGDIVWTSVMTYLASATCARHLGADVEFIDIDQSTFNMSIETVEARLAEAKNKGRLPKVLVAVHFSGFPMDMMRLGKICKEYGVYLVEDAAHALGSRYYDAPVGSLDYVDFTVFSFHAVKNLSIGEGGMVVSRNVDAIKRVRMFCNQGVVRDETEYTEAPFATAPCYYQQQVLGFNFRMTEYQAALGISQLRKIDRLNSARQQIVDVYRDAFSGLGLEFQAQNDRFQSSNHLFVVLFPVSSLSEKIKIFNHFLDKEIRLNQHYMPLHLQPYFAQDHAAETAFSVAEDYYLKSFTLPLFPSMTERDIELVIQTTTSSIGLLGT